MSFTSAPFLAFVIALLVAYRASSLRTTDASDAQRRRVARRARALLLTASVAFYAWWDWRFALLVMAGALVDFALARRIAGSEGGARTAWLASSLGYNILLLAGFKYSSFISDSVGGPHFDVVVPLGVSFFTFQAMSYTIDVYRRACAPATRFVDFALSLTFFPHLAAGPIVRARDFMPQLDTLGPLRSDDLRAGSERFLCGFLKKVLFADTFAVCADTVFASPAALSSTTVWLGVAAYTAQIYYDFSGYSDMAIGLARMFGLRFPENFAHPYLSRSPREFWHRWHISLSLWLRDYLYVPLGGSRRGRARTVVNVFLTMLIGGLWHGAAWTFVAWGALHGAALAVQRTFAWRTKGTIAPGVVSWAATMLLVMVGWVLFRAPDFATAWLILQKMAFLDDGGAVWPHAPTMILLVVAIALHVRIALRREGAAPLQFDVRKPAHVVAAFACVLWTLLFAPMTHTPFIYAGF
jgi:alginate O-acetyltransferase complex protein AlgI